MLNSIHFSRWPRTRQGRSFAISLCDVSHAQFLTLHVIIEYNSPVETALTALN